MFDVWADKWLSEPNKESFKLDTMSLRVKASAIINAIEDLESDKKSTTKEKHEKAIILREKIGKMRNSGLEKGGEFSIENLCFKYLRNHNYLSKLHDIIQTSFDSNLSLK